MRRSEPKTSVLEPLALGRLRDKVNSYRNLFDPSTCSGDVHRFKGKRIITVDTPLRPIAGDRNVSPVRLDYGPRNSQAQAGAYYAEAAGPIGAVEPVEDMG